ncbi:MAG: hypothetical protein AAF721_17750 [Myxococcota bacterium]
MTRFCVQLATLLVAPIATAAPADQDASPCGEDQDEDLDLNPAFLRPDKQGWITDPTPHAAQNG